MKHISILALKDATITSIDSSYQILNRVNDFLRYQGKAPFYTVEIVGLEKNVQLDHGLYNINVSNTISDIRKTDVIVIPLLCGDFTKALKTNEGYVDWLISQYHNGAEIVSLCVGSFFLASTGLLKNRKCAIHWAARNDFEVMFPEVHLINDTIITDENGIYTCGGGYSYLNLLLYIIEKHHGREMSILASKMFEIDIERKSQNPFMIFMGQKKHGDKEVLSSQEWIENNPTETFTVDEICAKMAVGRRTFERRFKKCTGNSVAEYIQRVKVEYTKKQLESGRKTVNEIIYDVGYNNIDAFRKVFKKHTDLSPLDYRKKYSA
ncbi:MAG: helix-turn-helix domain-containing protein [Dyadobacter sp.]|uniref:GlxA family transcriptional regulator n=1 Tax=Dyadobacter sp. TaxID=1914288 RepID=UPI0032642E85